MCLTSRENGVIRIQSSTDGGAALRRFMWLVHEQLYLTHMIALHGRSTHRDAVPNFGKQSLIFSVSRRVDPGTRLKCDRKSFVPYLELLFDVVPVVQQGSLVDASPGSCFNPNFEIVACSHEVYKFGHEPHESVADQIFFHHFLAFGVAAFSGIAGENVSVVVDQEACLFPEGEILCIEACVCFIDD